MTHQMVRDALMAIKESRLLGLIMTDDGAMASVPDALNGSHFFRERHGLIYNAMRHLYGEGQPIDPITVAEELEKRHQLASVGGIDYLDGLVNREGEK